MRVVGPSVNCARKCARIAPNCAELRRIAPNCAELRREPSRSFCFATIEASRMSGIEWSVFLSRRGRRSGTNGAMSDDSLTRAHRLEVHTVAFLTSS